MGKLIQFFRVARDIFFQIESNTLKRFLFLYSLFAHYFLKIFRIEYNPFPEMKIRVGDLIFITRKNTIDFWMCWKGYEKGIFNQLEKEIGNGDTFIDVGANIGRYTNVMAKNGLNVYSFEPIKSNFNLLNKNIKSNNLIDFVKTYNIGLGDKREEKKISYNPHEHGEASVVIDFGRASEMIKIDRLDNLKINVKNKCFMKIDVEGFEYEVLLGSKKFIEKNKPLIVIEIWNKETEKYLKDLGYIRSGELWYYKKK